MSPPRPNPPMDLRVAAAVAVASVAAFFAMGAAIARWLYDRVRGV